LKFLARNVSKSIEKKTLNAETKTFRNMYSQKDVKDICGFSSNCYWNVKMQ